MANQIASDLIGAVERIGPLIADHAPAAGADRQLSDAVYQAMYDAGLFGMLAPKADGGLELPPADCLRVWEAIARIDAAAAWNLVMNQAIATYSAWLPPKGIAELYAGGIPTVAGAFHRQARQFAPTAVGGSAVIYHSAAAAIKRGGWRYRQGRADVDYRPKVARLLRQMRK